MLSLSGSFETEPDDWALAGGFERCTVFFLGGMFQENLQEGINGLGCDESVRTL